MNAIAYNHEVRTEHVSTLMIPANHGRELAPYKSEDPENQAARVANEPWFPSIQAAFWNAAQPDWGWGIND